MDDKALFVRFTADAGHKTDVADFLRGALGPIEEESDTRDWYAIRFTPTDYAVVDTFPDNLPGSSTCSARSAVLCRSRPSRSSMGRQAFTRR